MHVKKQSRVRRARRSRRKMRELGNTRLTVHRTSRHIYAQIVTAEADRVVAHASTLDPSFGEDNTGNKTAAARVGTLIADRAQQAGVKRVAFDRSGFKYHGRVKELADAAREHGLEF